MTKTITTIALAVALAACGGKPKTPPGNRDTMKPIVDKAPDGVAKVNERKAEGGVIELQGDRGKAMDDANKQMEAHCGPGNYQITSEGEEAIGGSSATVWRVHYQCAGAAP